MGFFGRLFGKKRDKSAPSSDRRRWSFTTRSSNPPSNSSKRRSPETVEDENGLDADKHAIAVAAATAAVAEAALAAAHAAAEVVRLTSGTGSDANSSVFRVGGSNRRWPQEYRAAVKIQSAFRGYLARRALRALKALVKLQALVRGHIVRKQTADMLRRMQTLVRLQSQARARASRSSHSSASFHSSTALLFPSSSSSPRSLHTRCVSNAEVFVDHHRGGSKRLDWQAEGDEEQDKILEVDTWKPRYHHHPKPLRSERNNESPRKRQQSPLGLRSTENSPQVGSSGSRRRTPFTPTTTRSEYSSWGCNSYYYSGYHPNYMANTESYNAKVRSQSAPKQRLEVSDETSGYKRSVQGQYYYYAAVSEQSSDVGSAGYYGEGGGISERLNRNQSAKSRMHSSFLV